MERLQKKCMVGSLMTHCALVGVLSLAAFTSQPTFKSITSQDDKILKDIKDHELTLVAVTDQETRIGGSKPAQAAPKQPEEPKPVPVAPPAVPVAVPAVQEPPPVAPSPKPERIEVPKADKPLNPTVINDFKVDDKKKKTAKKPPEKPKPKDDDDEKPAAKNDAKDTKKPTVKVDLTAKVINPSVDVDKRKKAQQEAADARQRRIEQENYERGVRQRQEVFSNLGKGLDRLDSSLTGGGVDIKFAPGSGSGPTFVNYAAYVREVYDRNWVVSDSVIDGSGIVTVEIVVQRNGSARGKIIKQSGNSALDRTVQTAINRVSNIGQTFPEGATDNTRTFIINFNLSSKRRAG